MTKPGPGHRLRWPGRSDLAQALKWTAATADRFRSDSSGIVVLIYHRVGGGSGLELDLSIPGFEEQMSWLCDQELVVSLDDAIGALANPPASARDRVVITFDDGTSDFVDHAMPVLDRLRLPVTLYLATRFVDEGRKLPYGAPPTSWAALRDAMTSGLLTVASHTHSHSLLDRLDPAAIADELDTSRFLIEEELGVVPDHFAYPKALPGSAAAEQAVRERFRSAALAGTRTNWFGDTDPYRLARSPIQVSDGMRWFVAKARGGMALEDDLRRAMNRLRYRGADS